MKHNLLKTLLVSALAIGAWEGVSADTGDVIYSNDFSASDLSDFASWIGTGKVISGYTYPQIGRNGSLSLSDGTLIFTASAGKSRNNVNNANFGIIADDYNTKTKSNNYKISFTINMAVTQHNACKEIFEISDDEKKTVLGLVLEHTRANSASGTNTISYYTNGDNAPSVIDISATAKTNFEGTIGNGNKQVLYSDKALTLSKQLDVDIDVNTSLGTAVLNISDGTDYLVKDKDVVVNPQSGLKYIYMSGHNVWETSVTTMTLDNFSIKEGDTSTAETSSYIVKRVCGDVTLSEETLTSEVGTTPSFTTDAILKDGNKYIYESNNAEEIGGIANDGTTVYTLTYREVKKIETVKVNYVCDGEIVAEDNVALDGSYEGDVVNVPFRYYLRGNDDNLYQSKNNTSGSYYRESITLSASENVITKNVTKAYDSSDVVLFEDLDGSTGNSADIRASYGSAYDNKSYTSAKRLTPGKYTVLVRVHNKGRGSSLTIGDEDICQSSEIAKNSWGDITKKEVEISKRGVVAWKGTSATDPIDIILIVKTGDAETETATITDAGFATYVSSNNVKIPENVTVYTAKVEDGKVNLTKVDAGTVLCGNAGYILAGAAGDYNFTVTNDVAAATLPSSDLKPAFQDVTADGTQYVLAKQGDMVGFSKVEAGTTIAAGKAYIKVGAADQALAKAFLAIGGNTTGIETIEAAPADNDAYYSISGVKTTRPAKGLYIHNGKKVIVK